MSTCPINKHCGVAALLSTFILGGTGAALGIRSAQAEGPLEKALATRKHSNLRISLLETPISFEAREPGQFSSRGPGLALELRPTGAEITLQPAVKLPAGVRTPSPTRIRMGLAGGNPAAKPLGEGMLRGKVNYFRGKDPAKWKTDIATYASVRYDEVYPGIDMVYHASLGALEYDFVVAPGADPGRINLAFKDGAGARRKPEIAADGSLLLRTGSGTLRHEKPLCYQERDSVRTAVSSRYTLAADGGVQFALGEFDRTLPLVIDPTLAYSSYLGTAGNDVGFGVALDPAGFVYVTGQTPRVGGNDTDIFVAKVDPSSAGPNSLVFTTIFGGTSGDSSAFCDMGIAVDANGSAYVSGFTDSADFPTLNAYDSTKGATFGDAFVTKLNSGGGLVYSTFLGGDGWDYGHDITVDDQGRAHVAGGTISDNFPLTGGAIQTVNQGGLEDAFVTVLNANGQSLAFSTLLGGDGTDDAYSIALGPGGLIYIGGKTSSSGSKPWPTTANAYQGTKQDSNGAQGDAFVAKIDRNRSGAAALLYSTYVGGSADDNCWGVAADSSGNAYITGVTTSTNFPTLAAIQPNKKGTWDAFITKLSTSGATTSIIYSTYLGTFHGTRGFDIQVDGNGAAYVFGDTNWGNDSSLFPSVNPLPGMTLGQGDSFLVKLTPVGTSFTYATMIGGSGGDSANTLALGPGGLALDALGNAFIAGTTFSSNFPVQNGAQPSLNGTNSDAYVAVVTEGGLAGLFTPTSLRVTSRTTTSISLAWQDNSRGETSYEVERTQGGSPTTITLGANASTYTDANLTSGVTYTYRVRARLGAQASNYSNAINSTTAPPAPNAPFALNATPTGPRQVTLSWQDTNPAEDSFEIERRLEGGTFTFLAGVGANTTSYVDNAAKGNRTYEYQIRAVNDGGASPYSNIATATTVEPPPTAPSSVALTVASATQIGVRWRDNSSNEDEFIVERKVGTGNFTELTRVTGTVSITDNNLTPHTSYSYRIIATGEAGTSAPSTAATALTLPNAPTALAVTAQGGTSITLAWTHTGGTASFKLERRTASGNFVELPATISGELRSYTDSGLTARTQYSYRIKAANTSGSTAVSNTVITSTLTPITAVRMSPASVKGGASAKCIVTMGGVAPAGGAALTLSGSNPAAIVPPTGTVPAGTSTANITVKTKKVSRNTTVTITVSYGSQQLTTRLTVKK